MAIQSNKNIIDCSQKVFKWSIVMCKDRQFGAYYANKRHAPGRLS